MRGACELTQAARAGRPRGPAHVDAESIERADRPRGSRRPRPTCMATPSRPSAFRPRLRECSAPRRSYRLRLDRNHAGSWDRHVRSSRASSGRPAGQIPLICSICIWTSGAGDGSPESGVDRGSLVIHMDEMKTAYCASQADKFLRLEVAECEETSWTERASEVSDVSERPPSDAHRRGRKFSPRTGSGAFRREFLS